MNPDYQLEVYTLSTTSGPRLCIYENSWKGSPIHCVSILDIRWTWISWDSRHIKEEVGLDMIGIFNQIRWTKIKWEDLTRWSVPDKTKK